MFRIKQLIFFFLSNFCCLHVYSQTKSLLLQIGKGTHGTGDMKGFYFDAAYQQSIQKKTFYLIGVGATIHDRSETVFYNNNSGVLQSSTYRANASGFQLFAQYGIHLIQSKWLNVGVKAGPLLRFQSSTYYDELGKYYPILTNFPFVLYDVVHTSPLRTYTIGGVADLFVQHHLNKKIVIGANLGLQSDSNGDLITRLGVSIGRNF